MTPRLTLLLLVSSACHASESSALDPNVGPPTIVSQPADKAVSPGQAATFMVRATGPGTLWYQWERNGVPVDAATLTAYATDPTALADDGATFDVVVKSVHGSVTSRAAKLSVRAGGPKTLTLHTVAETGQGDAPFLAFQDGDGPWQTVAPDPNGDHAFTVTNERFGVAVADPPAALGYVFQGTVAEVEDLFLPLEARQNPARPVVATLTGIDADRGYLAGCQGSVAAPGGRLACSLPSGANDVVAVEDKDIRPTAFIVRRGVQVFESGTSDLGLYDFGSSLAFTPEDHILTVHRVLGGSYVGVESGLRLRAGAEVLDYTFSGDPFGASPYVDPNGDLIVRLHLVPPAQLAPGDVQYATVQLQSFLSTNTYAEWFHDTADRTMVSPDGFTSSASLAASSPYPRVRADWEPIPSLLLYTMSAASDGVRWSCAVSRGWLGGAPTAQYTFPDFSAVAGWSPDLVLSGKSIDVALRGDSYVDVKRSLALAIYDQRLAPPRGDSTGSVWSIVGRAVSIHVP